MGQAEENLLKSVKFWIMYYVHRVIRLTPTYMLILAVAVTVYPRLGEGPMWQGDQDSAIHNCYKTWWGNLFYVNNFFNLNPGEEMCMGWSWYLAVDMQFYIFAPILLVLLFVIPIAGIIVSVLLIAVSALIRALFVVNNGYPPTVTSTVNASKFFGLGDFARDVYFKPYTRCGPYILGILLGYLVWKTRGTLPHMKKWLKLLIWTLIFLSTFAVIFGLYSYVIGGHMSPTVRGTYAAINRTLWGAAVCGVIYMCLQGHGGIADTFLSWKLWVPLSRLTYCAYLIHPLVIKFFYSTLTRPEHAETYNFVYHFVSNLVIAYGIAFLATLAFESPVIGLGKIWMDPIMWKKQESTGLEPVKDRFYEVRQQFQEGMKKMQLSKEQQKSNTAELGMQNEAETDIEMDSQRPPEEMQKEEHKPTVSVTNEEQSSTSENESSIISDPNGESSRNVEK